MASVPEHEIQNQAPVDNATRALEDQSIETVLDPTAEEAQRAVDQLNTAADRDPAPAKPEKGKAESPFAKRDEIAKNYRASRSRESRGYVEGTLNDPAVIAGQSIAEHTLRGDPTSSAEEREPEIAPPAPEPRKIKIKVSGTEVEVPEDKLIESFQKNAEADRRLQEATRMQREAEQFRAMAEQHARQAQARPTNQEAQPAPHQPIAPTHSQGGPTRQAGLTQDEWMEVANRLQVGATEEAAEALRTAFERNAAPQQQQQPLDLNARVGQAVEHVLAEREDLSNSKSALQSFVEKYPGIAEAEHAPAQVLVSSLVESEMVRDLTNVGLTREEVTKLWQIGRLRDSHKLLRNDPGFKSIVRSQDAILASIEKHPDFEALKPRLAGRAPVSVNVDRSARKQGVQPQPAHRSIPTAVQAQQQEGDRHQRAFAKMKQARGQLVA